LRICMMYWKFCLHLLHMKSSFRIAVVRTRYNFLLLLILMLWLSNNWHKLIHEKTNNNKMSAPFRANPASGLWASITCLITVPKILYNWKQ
jgi:hypothetical protein